MAPTPNALHQTMDTVLEGLRIVLLLTLSAVIGAGAFVGIARLFGSSPFSLLRYLFVLSFAFTIVVAVFSPLLAFLDRALWRAFAWAFWFLWWVSQGTDAPQHDAQDNPKRAAENAPPEEPIEEGDRLRLIGPWAHPLS